MMQTPLQVNFLWMLFLAQGVQEVAPQGFAGQGLVIAGIHWTDMTTERKTRREDNI